MDQDVPKVHDGDRVREIVEKSNLQVEGFASEMGWNQTKLYRMFKRDSWRASELMRAGLVLRHDFLAIYRTGEETPSRTTATILVPVTIALTGDLELTGFGDLSRVLSPFPPKT